MNIYRRPANRFVGVVHRQPGDEFHLGRSAGGRIPFYCWGERRSQTSGLEVGREIPDGAAVLGIRPEDFSVRGGGAPICTVELDVIEHMGHETMAHFKLSGADQIARLPANAAIQPGDQLTLSVPPSAYHLFSATDGRRLN